ncbi:GTP-binding protein [Aestuariirhabdus sp. Z084]|uniref:CobW family GTP-binding protein n=1 Tax=Aestuariirhabdus haliotis TaxID=2918751 RepID=UPI00201B38E5|nr:GTP-binding protein [Aestuariirhabdus haliotis]MCL6417120.1 GTP-binding protein [Aestuariirhabdus haliotis]MCL6421070.1 GTP-binding protein [Aestuariirhabdus haliotis]
MTNISNIPTNILTGFLGAGKTSAILQLLKQKPTNERWAVLVNEFGEIGVDGSFFQGQHKEESGIFIREVPGGCMCCAAGLPMQVALNMLLARAKPQRLLIEPTGLGHPLEVLQRLSSDYYRELLSIQQVVTLVDARQLSNPRYTEHDTFNQQIAIADLVVGNKQDLYEPGDQDTLQRYVKTKAHPDIKVVFAEQGQIDLALLNGPTQMSLTDCHHSHQKENPSTYSDTELPDCGYLKAVNQGEGFASVGWRFSAERTFDRTQLIRLLTSLEAERIKAVFITEDGIFGYNLASDGLTEIELEDCLESRIEIIATHIVDDWEQRILACQVSS